VEAVNLDRVASGAATIDAKEKESTVEGHIRSSSVEMLLSPLSSFSLISFNLIGMLNSKSELVVSKRVVSVMSPNLGSGSLKQQSTPSHCHPTTAGVTLQISRSAISENHAIS
jgi:hypothetical protein